MAHASNIVEIEITFECALGHPIMRTLTHFQEHGAHRLIEEQRFDGLECSECGWTGSKRGIERKGLKVR